MMARKTKSFPARGNGAIRLFMKHDVQQAIANLARPPHRPADATGSMQFCAVAVLKQKDDSGLAYCDEALRADPKDAATYGISRPRAAQS